MQNFGWLIYGQISIKNKCVKKIIVKKNDTANKYFFNNFFMLDIKFLRNYKITSKGPLNRSKLTQLCDF